MTQTLGVRPIVMLVEDNPLITEFVQARLQAEAFEVITAEGCKEAIDVLHNRQPDLLVLDVVLDDGLGYDLCREIRAGGEDNALMRMADLPVLMLTARANERDRIEGFQAGADDYLTKPFSPDELVFRIQAILRRSGGVSSALIESAPLQIDPRRREVLIDGNAIELTPKEFDLLHLLASNIGRVFSREELLEKVWGYSFLGNTRTVDVHVNRLRQKLAEYTGCSEMISTEWGVGYKFVPMALERAIAC